MIDQRDKAAACVFTAMSENSLKLGRLGYPTKRLLAQPPGETAKPRGGGRARVHTKDTQSGDRRGCVQTTGRGKLPPS
jgi:hypothetical protein